MAAVYAARATEDDTISQSFATTAGTSYTVNFQLSVASGETGSTPNDFNPSVGGPPLTQIFPPPSYFAVPCADCISLGYYQFFSLTFDATASSTTISFGGLNNPYYTYLTDVVVCASDAATTWVP